MKILDVDFVGSRFSGCNNEEPSKRITRKGSTMFLLMIKGLNFQYQCSRTSCEDGLDHRDHCLSIIRRTYRERATLAENLKADSDKNPHGTSTSPSKDNKVVKKEIVDKSEDNTHADKKENLNEDITFKNQVYDNINGRVERFKFIRT
ncbi:hypothetical protein HAX54_005066 [Datura stramonium]|uniref:Uncharacterized protein n=1 Tax=Datura stramonium TaxID=4076 RepID=A0ABS8T986_DATST|nr:hypothetical protein [Datura stramonium]